MRDTFSGSRAYNQAGFVRQRATALSSRMTFPEALTEALETGCAIRPVGITDSCLLVRGNGRNPVFHLAELGMRGTPKPSEPGTYLVANLYLRQWEVCLPSRQPQGRTLADLYPELAALKSLERELTLSDLGHVSAKPEKKWRLSDLL